MGVVGDRWATTSDFYGSLCLRLGERRKTVFLRFYEGLSLVSRYRQQKHDYLDVKMEVIGLLQFD